MLSDLVLVGFQLGAYQREQEGGPEGGWRAPCMHGELPGAASAFLSVASRVEVATFFRYLREDVSQVDDDDMQAVFQLTITV